MKVTKTDLDGVLIIEPDVYKDERGYYFESYNYDKYKNIIGDINFIQDSESFSKGGVVRGLHYQKPPYTQAKLVRVVKGEVIDVIVDIRTDSSTFGKHIKISLSDDNKKQVFIPRGFAHGFLTTTDKVIFAYKVDNVYNPPSESGIVYNDSDLNIDWFYNGLIVNKKDEQLLSFKYNVFFTKEQYLLN